MVCAIALIGYQGMLNWSASLTLLSHTYIYGLLVGVIIVFYKVILRETLQKTEKIGAIVAIIGCAIAIFDFGD